MKDDPTIDWLRRICQTKKDEPFLLPIMRKGSIYITYVLIKTKITANQVTYITISLDFIAGFFLSFGQYWYSIFAGLILLLTYLLDCVDGEIARYSRYVNQAKDDRAGVFLENIHHMIEAPVIFIGVTYGIFNATGETIIFTLCTSSLFFFFAFRSINSYISSIRFHNFTYESSIWSYMPFLKSKKSLLVRVYISKKVRKIFFTIFRSNFLNVLTLCVALVNRMDIILILHGILFPPFVIVYAYLCLKQSQNTGSDRDI